MVSQKGEGINAKNERKEYFGCDAELFHAGRRAFRRR